MQRANIALSSSVELTNCDEALGSTVWRLSLSDVRSLVWQGWACRVLITAVVFVVRGLRHGCTKDVHWILNVMHPRYLQTSCALDLGMYFDARRVGMGMVEYTCVPVLGPSE
eukprot:scaffold867_cov317-Pavlova_lutheri.AAC.11